MDKASFTAGIIELQREMLAKGTDATEYYAGKLADLIEAFIKSATVTVAAGIPVSTTGTAAAQTGSTTATGTGTIN